MAFFQPGLAGTSSFGGFLGRTATPGKATATAATSWITAGARRDAAAAVETKDAAAETEAAKASSSAAKTVAKSGQTTAAATTKSALVASFFAAGTGNGRSWRVSGEASRKTDAAGTTDADTAKADKLQEALEHEQELAQERERAAARKSEAQSLAQKMGRDGAAGTYENILGDLDYFGVAADALAHDDLSSLRSALRGAAASLQNRAEGTTQEIAAERNAVQRRLESAFAHLRELDALKTAESSGASAATLPAGTAAKQAEDIISQMELTGDEADRIRRMGAGLDLVGMDFSVLEDDSLDKAETFTHRSNALAAKLAEQYVGTEQEYQDQKAALTEVAEGIRNAFTQRNNATQMALFSRSPLQLQTFSWQDLANASTANAGWGGFQVQTSKSIVELVLEAQNAFRGTGTSVNAGGTLAGAFSNLSSALMQLFTMRRGGAAGAVFSAANTGTAGVTATSVQAAGSVSVTQTSTATGPNGTTTASTGIQLDWSLSLTEKTVLQPKETVTSGGVSFSAERISLSLTSIFCDPLVLDMNGDGIDLRSMEDGVEFDIDGDGVKQRTGFIRGDDALLFIDDGSGVVRDARQLFGDHDGDENGFAKLAQYDSNGDGVIDENDEIWKMLRIWQDWDGDGVSTAGETKSMAEAGIKSLSVGYRKVDPQDNNGNRISEVGSFTRTDGTRSAMVDAWFRAEA